MNRRNPNARSPTPPSRVVKSTYGGNLFTHEDIEYLKKYIDYCVAQGLVLSLREICERVAVKVCCLPDLYVLVTLKGKTLGPSSHVCLFSCGRYVTQMHVAFTHGVDTATSIRFASAVML